MGFKSEVKKEVERIISSLPGAKEALAAQEAERRTFRRAALVEISLISSQEEEVIPSLVREVSAAVASVREIQAALNQAVAAHQAAQQKLSSLTLELFNKRKKLERNLKETAPAVIHEFIREIEAIPGQAVINNSTQMVSRPFNQLSELVTSARRRAEEMLIEDLSTEEIESELGRLRASLPAISGAQPIER